MTLTYGYDGPLVTSEAWSGAGGRTWQYDYNALGLLESIEDPLGRVTGLEYDAADRLKTQTLPGNRLIRFYYDRSGNVDSLTPPGKALAHGFRHTGIDLNDRYSPPVVAGVPIPATSYEYNRDGQVTAVERPDDLDLSLA